MAEKKLPFTASQLNEIIKSYPTPFHIYDEKAMRENARRLNKAFAWNEGFKEYYAVKACPNPVILKVLKQEGFGADCSSHAELVLSEKSGIVGEEIMFTSNDTQAYEFAKAVELGAIINLDDITHIEYLEKHCGIPKVISTRYNPGNLRQGSMIMGSPEEAKYGFTREQIFEGYKMLKEKGSERFGLHAFVASNELNPEFFIETARMLFELAIEIKERLDIRVEFVNISGGIGIPYKPTDVAVDLEYVGKGIETAYNEMIVPNGLAPMKLFMESGRMVTGPYGFLVSKVLHIKDTYKKFVGVDACMADLMRPAIYNAYHHVTVMDKENETEEQVYDVTGSICESFDRFAVNRSLPKINIGDTIVVHDTGAHGYSMGFSYNGKLKSAELLLRENGSVTQIRRAETLSDYFATLDFEDLKKV